MIELDRHIEILLLSNDCVIVPGLGGFMTHHVDARYDADDQMFLPPLRTLGFSRTSRPMTSATPRPCAESKARWKN